MCSQFWSKQANWQAPRYYVLHLKEQVVTSIRAPSPVCIRKHNTNIKAKKKETKIKHSFVQITCQPVIRQISTTASVARVVICDVGDFNSVFSFVFEAIRGRQLAACVCVFNPREFGCYGALSKVKQYQFVIFELYFLRCFRNLKRKCWGFGALIRETVPVCVCSKPETQSRRISSFEDKEIK